MSAPGTIGSATMTADGVIVMRLRAEGPGGLCGDASIEYAPGDAQYQATLARLGGLTPGETKLVPAWPEA